MNFELFVSLRYLLAKRRQTFISLITFISIAGVAVGVTALIVVLAVMNGFQDDLRNRILGITSHVVVGSFNGVFTDYRNLIEEVEKEPGVVAATPFIHAQVMISSGKNVSGALLRGIDPQTAAKVINIQDNMIRGNLGDLRTDPAAFRRCLPPQPGIILGVELANNLGVRQGDWVTVISPTGRLTPMGQVPKSRLFQVVGIIQSGMYEYDNTLAYMSLTAAQQFLGIGDAVTGIELKLNDIYQAREVAESSSVAARASVLGARLDADEPQSFFRPETRKGGHVHHPHPHHSGGGVQHRELADHAGHGEDPRHRHPEGHGGYHREHPQDLCPGRISHWHFGDDSGAVGRVHPVQPVEEIPVHRAAPRRLLHFDPSRKNGAARRGLIALAAILISLVATLYPSRQAAKLDPAEALRYE